MSELSITVAHNNARLLASRDHADVGSGPSRIRLYDALGNVLVTIVLAKPCGAIVSDKLKLTQASATGDMVAADGAAVTGRWFDGNDVVIAEGAVTDNTGAGPFKIAGSTGTNLYAGGYAILGNVELD